MLYQCAISSTEVRMYEILMSLGTCFPDCLLERYLRMYLFVESTLIRYGTRGVGGTRKLISEYRM